VIIIALELKNGDNDMTWYQIIDLDHLDKIPHTIRQEENTSHKLLGVAPCNNTKLNHRFTHKSKDLNEFLPLERITKTSPSKSLKRSPIKQDNKPRSAVEREPYIIKWVDMSQKYGFGYKLSNNCYGVLFNDNTTLINYKETLLYIWMESSIEMRSEYTLDTYPKDKKYKCILYIKDYIDQEEDPQVIPIPWNGNTYII